MTRSIIATTLIVSSLSSQGRKPYAFFGFCLLIGLCVLTASPLLAEGGRKQSFFLDLNAYPVLTDTSHDNYFTVNAGATFGHGLSYFSLNNFGKRAGGSGMPDDDAFYSEQNLRWNVMRSLPLDLTVQMNFRSGENNDRYRLGVRWRLNDTGVLSDIFSALNLVYAINVHVVQFDHEEPYVWQMEHAFRMTFPALSDRLYLAGFVDHTFNQRLPESFPARPIVGEAQAGIRIVDQLFAVAEYRINEYRRSEVDNLALGLQYKITW
ncbi:hypothetical protein [Kordiimonas sp.]|uniref:hypothetical protein n=1 Tax=Kordiimonas sp. TaxID=1970157 RepID=UPI003A8E1DEA